MMEIKNTANFDQMRSIVERREYKWIPAKGGKAKRKQIFAQSKKNLNAPKDASNG
jgi:hypothetical protein